MVMLFETADTQPFWSVTMASYVPTPSISTVCVASVLVIEAPFKVQANTLFVPAGVTTAVNVVCKPGNKLV